MSFSWSTPSIPSYPGIKPVATNSFADALKRLAEHVEEKNKINANNSGTSSLVQLSTDFPNRMHPSHVNNPMSPEQALRLYTQYIHETERREDIRRSYLRTYSGSDGSNINSSILNRRLDVNDPYRFMAPRLSGPFHPSSYFPSLTQQTRMPPPPPSTFLFSNIKTTDTLSRTPTQENTDKKSEQSLGSSKPKLKLFRPYDLDSPNSNSHQTPPSSPSITKKSTPSPTILSNPDESQTTTTSFGKEKQLFNSLGLVQQSTDLISETSSSTTSEESSSIETVSSQQDNHSDKSHSNIKDSSLSVTFKRKSTFSSNTKQSSNRKQSKIDPIQNTSE
ncbi:unnamed protein product [Adineta steineri]|uniref:Uncharacterized protein n=1 Tax=Adineta steineri TaxID=433720 RepID=A0A814TW39_9BILA|nr:unnamed protein product [Adineta steineri]CAF1524665.1 unnamed protein product [Adineta steineri]